MPGQVSGRGATPSRKINVDAIADLVDSARMMDIPFTGSCLQEALGAYLRGRSRETLTNLRNWVKWTRDDLRRQNEERGCKY